MRLSRSFRHAVIPHINNGKRWCCAACTASSVSCLRASTAASRAIGIGPKIGGHGISDQHALPWPARQFRFWERSFHRQAGRRPDQRRALEIRHPERNGGLRFLAHEAGPVGNPLELRPAEFAGTTANSHLIDQAGKAVIETADPIANGQGMLAGRDGLASRNQLASPRQAVQIKAARALTVVGNPDDTICRPPVGRAASARWPNQRESRRARRLSTRSVGRSEDKLIVISAHTSCPARRLG